MVIDLLTDDALAIYTLLGEHGSLWLADCIATLSDTGDTADAQLHQHIAALYHEMMAGSV